MLLQAGGLAKIDGSKLALTPKGKKALSQPFHSLTLLRAAQPAEQLVLEQIATELAEDRWGLAEDAILAIAADTQEFNPERAVERPSCSSTAPSA